MQHDFQPSVGAQTVEFQLAPIHCMACADDLVTFVRRMAGVDEVRLNFPAGVLQVSFFRRDRPSPLRVPVKGAFRAPEAGPQFS